MGPGSDDLRALAVEVTHRWCLSGVDAEEADEGVQGGVRGLAALVGRHVLALGEHRLVGAVQACAGQPGDIGQQVLLVSMQDKSLAPPSPVAR